MTTALDALVCAEPHAPVPVDGVDVATTLRPADAQALSTVLRTATESGLALIPCGGRTQLSLGNRPARVDALLSTERLAGIDVFDPSEGVCHAAAGTSLGALRAEVVARGWELPLEGPDESTLGGVVASATIGPRCHGMGVPRDVVLGLEVMNASGVATHCGGRVVKNVTGYDLAKLYTGSLGTLVVLTAAWLRLRPAPEVARVFELPLEPRSSAEAAIEWSRDVAVRACGLVREADRARLVLELAGDAATVARSARRLESEARESDAEALEDLRRHQTAAPAAGLRFRLGVLPQHLDAALDALTGAGATCLAYPGLASVHATFESASQGVFALVAAAAEASGGGFLCESAAPDVKQTHDVFGGSEARVPLFRALKQRFDPDAVLSPGRMAGRV
jgi:glycolate oxidase FAD binding subunit